MTKADFTAWPRYKIDRARSNPPEKIAAAVVEKKAQLDLSPEAIAYSSSETMLGVIHAIQLLDKDSTSALCKVQGNVKLAVRCVFHGKLDTDSTANWTPIPRQTGQSVQRKLDTDSTPNWTV